MSNTRIFQNIIQTYEYARPGYPGQLFQDIVSFAGLKPDAELLEIGSGPGQATDYFVKSGYRITALEISQPQVRYLKQKYTAYPNFSAACSTFEAFSGRNNACDLIFSATAFHWIAPEVGYPKARDLLKPGGALAVFWHLASIVEPRTEPLNEIRNIYRRYAPELDDYISADEGEELHRLRLTQMMDGGFPSPASFVYRWEEAYSTERYLKLMQTYSDFTEISSGQQNAILNGVREYLRGIGDRVVIPQEVRMYISKKAQS